MLTGYAHARALTHISRHTGTHRSAHTHAHHMHLHIHTTVHTRMYTHTRTPTRTCNLQASCYCIYDRHPPLWNPALCMGTLCVLGHRRKIHLSTAQFLSSEANHPVQVSSPLVYVRIIWSARERSGSYIPSLEGLGYHLTTHCSANSPVLMHVSLRPHRGLMVKQKALQRKDAGICHGTCESEREPVLIRGLNQKRQQSCRMAAVMAEVMLERAPPPQMEPPVYSRDALSPEGVLIPLPQDSKPQQQSCPWAPPVLWAGHGASEVGQGDPPQVKAESSLVGCAGMVRDEGSPGAGTAQDRCQDQDVYM